MNKKLAILAIIIFSPFIMYAQEAEIYSNIDDIFDTAEDIEVEEVPTPEPVLTDGNELKESLDTIKFAGNLVSQIGIEQNLYPDFEFSEGGFTLENNISFYSRASDIFGVHGNFNLSFDGDNIDYELDKFYFDYLLSDLYLQAGRRSITWGNTLHTWMTDDDDDDNLILNDTIYQDLNIVTDASDNLTISLTKYFGASDINFLGLYNTDWDIGEDVTSDKIAFAVQSNIVTGPLATNIFGRIWANGDDDKREPVVGIDFTSAYKGFEFYSHNTLEFEVGQNTIYELPITPISASSFLGVWRTWNDPKIAFNIEYALGWDEDDGYTQAFAVDFGISHLFNNTSRLGITFEMCEDNFLCIPIYEFYDLNSATFDITIPIEYLDNEFTIAMDIGIIFDLDY